MLTVDPASGRAQALAAGTEYGRDYIFEYCKESGTEEEEPRHEHSYQDRVTPARFEQDGEIINGGFMVMEPGIFDYLDGDACVLEKGPIQKLAAEGQLASYRHNGFWQCMDTQREKKLLEELWSTGKAPWKLWED